MLFNSPEFIFLFLPLTLFIFFQIGERRYYRLAMAWLVIASLFFYGYWNPANLPLLLGSVCFNYVIGNIGFRRVENPATKQKLLILGVIVNLILLGYFKYANFSASIFNNLFSTNFSFGAIALPLGISFFTFQQIAYLVDAYQGKAVEKRSFLHYISFVTFFPYVTSGPLLRHREIVPQFADRQIYQFNLEDLAIGVTIFAIGLFKKMVLAESIAPYANQIFDAAAEGIPLTFVEAWVGALAFTLQLYFDFSGYSDMAIGTARMFGIKLPINFSSPYKAGSITDFWRRWHITLSNFLRDYLYIPLGGNRKGELRRYGNLMVTMLLGGLWHGAGWAFVIWGGLHGLYLSINHMWRSFRQNYLHHDLSQNSIWSRFLGWLITFLAVVVGWVFFRAGNLETAFTVLRGMIGINGISLPSELSNSFAFLQNWGVQFNDWMPNILIKIEEIEDVAELSSDKVLRITFGLLLFVWFMPNTQQWITEYRAENNPDPSGNFSLIRSDFWKKLQWRPNHFWAVISAFLTVAALLNLAKVSEFLYLEF